MVLGLVREGGVEPPRPFGHTDLNRARLPIPPLAPEAGQGYPSVVSPPKPASEGACRPGFLGSAGSTGPGRPADTIGATRAHSGGVPAGRGTSEDPTTPRG